MIIFSIFWVQFSTFGWCYFILFFSETRTKWKKRKRESQISKRQQRQDDEDDEEEDPNGEDDEREDDSEDQTHHPNPHSQAQHEIEVLSGDGVLISQFPRVIKRIVNRPHSSVMAIVTLERANEAGDNKGQLQNPPFLENVSHGQLQALSSVPADSPYLDQDRNDGGNSAYVITPPSILEGRGVVKRFGSRVLVVPMHSGSSFSHSLLLSISLYVCLA